MWLFPFHDHWLGFTFCLAFGRWIIKHVTSIVNNCESLWLCQNKKRLNYAIHLVVMFPSAFSCQIEAIFCFCCLFWLFWPTFHASLTWVKFYVQFIYTDTVRPTIMWVDMQVRLTGMILLHLLSNFHYWHSRFFHYNSHIILWYYSSC